MNKKEYKKPSMKIVMLHQQRHLLSGSVKGVQGTLNNYRGGANVEARSRDFGDWDDDDYDY